MAAKNTKTPEPPLDVKEFWGMLADIAMGQYGIEWQRLGNMQQSAGVLVAAIALIYSGLIFLMQSLITTPLGSNPIIDEESFVTLLVTLLFFTISIFYLFAVLWPKSFKTIAPPLKIDDAFKRDQDLTSLSTRVFALLSLLNQPIITIDSLVQKKQQKYHKALVATVISFVLTSLIIIKLLLKINMPAAWRTFYYITLAILTSLSICYIVFAKVGAYETANN